MPLPNRRLRLGRVGFEYMLTFVSDRPMERSSDRSILLTSSSQNASQCSAMYGLQASVIWLSARSLSYCLMNHLFPCLLSKSKPYQLFRSRFRKLFCENMGSNRNLDISRQLDIVAPISKIQTFSSLGYVNHLTPGFLTNTELARCPHGRVGVVVVLPSRKRGLAYSHIICTCEDFNI